MFNLICVTNRKLCTEDFLVRLEKIAAAHPSAIILREKDLSPEEYRLLAEQTVTICKKHDVLCILHGFADIAACHGGAVHLPMHTLRSLSETEKSCFTTIGASCHSVEEAVEAQQLGCTYVTAGHVFDTDCKKDLPGRGTDFLHKVCQSVSIPVYAIGGVNIDNFKLTIEAGAAGVCVMSGGMTCQNPQEYFNSFRAVTK